MRPHIHLIAFFCMLTCPQQAMAHPSVGMVMDSRGNLYYSDLNQVWMMKNGKKMLAVANVHTHELFIDNRGNLFGEHLWYAGDASKKFYHYYWRRNKDGKLDTLKSVTQAYVAGDFSFALDKEGNQYYCKFNDSLHLYKRNTSGGEGKFAEYDFRGVKFFFPQLNGDMYFIKQNNVFRIAPDGNVSTVASNVGSNKSMLWGVWQDDNRDVYVAAFGDKMIKKIDKNGKATEFYRSPGGWAPASGTFDKQNRLWILEWSDKNEVRAVMMRTVPEAKKKRSLIFPLSVGVTVMLAFFISFTKRRKEILRKHAKERQEDKA